MVALRRKVDDLTRAGKRQAEPFSKGEPKPDPKRPGRKRGEAYGARGFRPRPRPRRVDEDYDVSLTKLTGSISRPSGTPPAGIGADSRTHFGSQRSDTLRDAT